MNEAQRRQRHCSQCRPICPTIVAYVIRDLTFKGRREWLACGRKGLSAEHYRTTKSLAKAARWCTKDAVVTFFQTLPKPNVTRKNYVGIKYRFQIAALVRYQ